MHHGTHLDIVVLGQGRLVWQRRILLVGSLPDEVVALVALSEGGVVGMCLDVDGVLLGRLQEDVARPFALFLARRGEFSIFEGDGLCLVVGRIVDGIFKPHAGVVVLTLWVFRLVVGNESGQTILNEFAAQSLCSSPTYDEEVATGSCEGHIEQVEVVYARLQVLFGIIVVIDGVGQTRVVVDRNDGQFVEDRFVRLAPQRIGHLQSPIAPGDDDVVELQTFRFVDADDADALELVALDVHLEHLFVPGLE